MSFKDPKEMLDYYNAARNPQTHKGDYGRVYIIVGSEGMTGAAMLCAEAALRAGAGLVYLLSPGKLLPVYETGCREAVKIKIGTDQDGYFTQRHVREAADAIKYAGGHCAVVLGPGLGSRNETKSFIYGILSELSNRRISLILDADGLNAFYRQGDRLRDYGFDNMVITPHAAELSRLTLISIEEINAHRIEAANRAAIRTGAVTVLKGSGTVISAVLPSGGVAYDINPTGNAGMSTGGSGDVLSGIIAGIAASDTAGRPFYDIVRCGVYIHGLCGDIAAEKYGQRAVTAGDILEMLKEVYRHEN